MANKGQIRSLVRTNISQTDENNTDFTNSVLDGFINEGVRFLGALVKKPIDHVEIQAEENIPAYTLPTDAVFLLTAYFGDPTVSGDVRPLRVLTEEALTAIAPNWMDESTQSQGRPSRAILLDRKTVLVHPRPEASEGVSGKKIHLGYVYQPASLVDDSDSPDLQIVYHDLIALYAYQMCLFSKLNQPTLGAAILSQVIDKAKKLENLIIKDVETFGFTWGGEIDPNIDGITVVRP